MGYNLMESYGEKMLIEITQVQGIVYIGRIKNVEVYIDGLMKYDDNRILLDYVSIDLSPIEKYIELLS